MVGPFGVVFFVANAKLNSSIWLQVLQLNSPHFQIYTLVKTTPSTRRKQNIITYSNAITCHQLQDPRCLPDDTCYKRNIIGKTWEKNHNINKSLQHLRQLGGKPKQKSQKIGEKLCSELYN